MEDQDCEAARGENTEATISEPLAERPEFGSFSNCMVQLLPASRSGARPLADAGKLTAGGISNATAVSVSLGVPVSIAAAFGERTAIGDRMLIENGSGSCCEPAEDSESIDRLREHTDALDS